jgi:hypothetical protein
LNSFFFHYTTGCAEFCRLFKSVYKKHNLANPVATMAAIAPKVSLAVPLGKLARAIPRAMSKGAIAPQATSAVSVRAPHTNNTQARYGSSQTSSSTNKDTAPKGLLPEFDLRGKVIVVSGGAQGLGIVQAEALLEAGATGRLSCSPNYPHQNHSDTFISTRPGSSTGAARRLDLPGSSSTSKGRARHLDVLPPG